MIICDNTDKSRSYGEIMKYFHHIALLIATMIPASWPQASAADNSTGIVNPRFASLQAYAGDDKLNDPVLTLDDDRRLTVEFDELADDVRYMRYSVTHCNADWQPSQLVESEFIDGFNEGTIDEYEFSRATTVHYVHYRLELPNEKIRLTASGNYILRVYDESDPDATLLRVRFMVTEQSITLQGSVSSRTDIDYNARHQQLSLRIDAGRINVNDAFNDFKIVISQNGRLDNQRLLIHPLRLQGNTLIYEHMPELIFEGGNEYRRFETVSTHISTMGIDEVSYHGPYYHAWVSIDSPRADAPYLYDSTQHGRYVIREYNSTRSDTEADYMVTHFALESPRIDGADVYLDGDFVNRRFDGRSRLDYNEQTGRYETAMLLKQGAYNYQYLVRPAGSACALTSPVEGDFYNTVNEYRIAVYHRLPGDRYDRLLGYYTIMSQ